MVAGCGAFEHPGSRREHDYPLRQKPLDITSPKEFTAWKAATEASLSAKGLLDVVKHGTPTPATVSAEHPELDPLIDASELATLLRQGQASFAAKNTDAYNFLISRVMLQHGPACAELTEFVEDHDRRDDRDGQALYEFISSIVDLDHDDTQSELETRWSAALGCVGSEGAAAASEPAVAGGD